MGEFSPWGLGPNDRWAPVRLVTTAACFALGYAIAFPLRLDYSAHLLAGAGTAVSFLMLVDWRRSRGSPRHRADPLASMGPVALGASTLAIVLLAAVVSELTLTGPDISPLDVVNTLVGGVIGLATLAPARATTPSTSPRMTLLIAAACLILMGLAVRYQVQPVVKHWWWGAP